MSKRASQQWLLLYEACIELCIFVDGLVMADVDDNSRTSLIRNRHHFAINVVFRVVQSISGDETWSAAQMYCLYSLMRSDANLQMNWENRWWQVLSTCHDTTMQGCRTLQNMRVEWGGILHAAEELLQIIHTSARTHTHTHTLAHTHTHTNTHTYPFL